MAITINLGDEARDTITGFSGVVIGVTKWLHGCERITIQPREMKDGRPVDSLTFDLPQIELVESNVAATTSKTGGPRPEPRRTATPSRF